MKGLNVRFQNVRIQKKSYTAEKNGGKNRNKRRETEKEMHEKGLEFGKIMFKSPKSRLSAAKMYKSKKGTHKILKILL